MRICNIVAALRDRRGATTIEYGLFLGFAALVLSSGLSTVGGGLGGVFNKAGQAMASAPSAQSAVNASVEHIDVRDAQNGFLSNHQSNDQQ